MDHLAEGLWDVASAPAPLLRAGADRLVHGLGPLYVVQADGSTLTLARDGLGSVRAELTDAGAVLKSLRYAYGEIARTSAPGAKPTLLGYAGELLDPSGLIYLRSRWYDQGTGRFMSRDPLPGDVNRPASLNPFAYAVSHPTRWTDPTGLSPMGSDTSSLIRRAAAIGLNIIDFVLFGPGSSVRQTDDGVLAVTNANAGIRPKLSCARAALRRGAIRPQRRDLLGVPHRVHG